MMEVKAVVRPNKLAALRTALLEVPGFPGMTVTKVEGCSAANRTEKVNIKDELTDYSAKIKIEMICNDEAAQILMDRIVAICQTGQIGDGIVWCTEVPKAFFIAKSSTQ
ncbi:nitrogen regulatory protein P-II [Polynucleobacter sp. TUM22923]|jgi:nitrogen regulatory protein P-II 1|uniref:P-II family nitrogen regulator n=1 Tax=Polynucleobacter sp. TUM22923 TaxID=3022126 RepID=UPI002573A291|nr:P-II family nitrogen regulator [Polynucleobacter sp. TUM22923]BDX21031.1 nitrogen regulatory protein P-II [Polynucleobacter sp. TUM22923]